MNKEEIVNEIVNKMGDWTDLNAYERVLIDYVVEETIKKVKK